MARLFLSTDDNAPVLAGTDRTCLVNLLKKCLIEGYGSKQPVGGWTMPYASTDGRIAVFRNDHENGGLGHYLRLGQDNDGAYNARDWNLSAFENMTDENTGTFPYMSAAASIQISSTTNNAVRPWLLVATNTWMFLVVFNNQTAMPTALGFQNRGFWFGDIEPWSPSDNFHAMFSLVGGDSFGLTAGTGNTPKGYLFPRSAAGNGAPAYQSCHIPLPQEGGRLGAHGPAYDATSGLLVGRPAFSDYPQYSLRGWLPNALVPLHPRPFAHLERVTIGGASYVAVTFWTAYSSVSNEYYSQLLFELDAGE